jgi:multidrug efflux pump subunit AcrA (membrane-fusion protein)
LALAAGAVGLVLVPAFPLHVHGVGRIESLEPRDVRAETPGFVVEVLVPEGVRVEKGQVLARLSNPDLSARLETMTMNWEMLRVEAAMRDAAGDASGAATRRDEGERQSAEIEIVRGRADHLALTAPARGVLMATRLADRLGTYLHEGDLWGTIAEGDRLRAIVEVGEPWLGDVRRGARVVVLQGGFPEERFDGHVVRMPGQSVPQPGVTVAGIASPPGGAGASIYGVEIEIENRRGELRPGMTAKIRIEGSRMSLAGRSGRAIMRLLKGKAWW